MGKQSKLKEAAKAQEAEAAQVGMKLGNHQFRVFDGMDASFGANIRDYPKMEEVPKHDLHRRYEDVVSSLFFRGGRLADYGLSLNAGLDHRAAMTAIKALMCSFEPKHEHKTAVVAWALREWCDGTPTRT
jgi:hypothetical protein